MVRSIATNQTGWVVEQFMLVEGEEKARWVAITIPGDKSIAESQLKECSAQNKDGEFRVYMSLK